MKFIRMKINEDGKVLPPKAWVPKSEEKIDFINNKNPFMATVVSVTPIDLESYTISLKYTDENDNLQTIESKFPSSNIFKCGEKLTTRSDCITKL